MLEKIWILQQFHEVCVISFFNYDVSKRSIMENHLGLVIAQEELEFILDFGKRLG